MQEQANQIEPRPGDTYNMPGTKGVEVKKVSKSSSIKSIDGQPLYYLTYEHNLGNKKGIQSVSVAAHRSEIVDPK